MMTGPDIIDPSPAASTPLPSPGAAHRAALRDFEVANYDALRRSRERHPYFHNYLTRLIANHVIPGSRVLDVGCGNGATLAALKPSAGVGIDLNPKAIEEAKASHGGNAALSFHTLAVEDLSTLPAILPAGGATFDYVILSGVLPQLYDLHTALEAIRAVCHDRTRLIICTFSRLWHPVLNAAETLKLRARVPDESWIPSDEVVNILSQSDFAVVRQTESILLPVYVPVISALVNRWVAPLPPVNKLGLCTMTIGRLVPRTNRAEAPSVSVVVPARNEAGNIRPLLERIPVMAARQEVIFVEGNSTDDTWEAIQRAVADYKEASGPFQLQAHKQTGKGKGDAVRVGFSHATGDILIILDADISVPPEELPQFVNLLARGRCEFANGSRLVYPMEKKAMRFLNMLANKSFGILFTYLLGQRLRDTLCGTKVLRRSDYERIAANRAYFGDFDPFGDYDLLFGAARLDLKMSDVPVHYKQRVYGETNISRFRHGWLLLRMCAFAARKIKFI